MQIPKTVVISCAGIGSRLGMGTTKALIEFGGKPLIIWQLEMLEEVEDIRIVVGFQAEDVIKTVLPYRRDVLFVFNHNYLSTRTAASLSLGSRHTKNMVVSLDGDLLIHPEDFKKFLSLDCECIGYGIPSTEEPVYVEIFKGEDGEWAKSFTREAGGRYEWTGLVQLWPDNIVNTTGHVYQILEPQLPIRAMQIRSQEVDTNADYIKALEWVKNL